MKTTKSDINSAEPINVRIAKAVKLMQATPDFPIKKLKRQYLLNDLQLEKVRESL